jgi:hypothetical protein
VPGESELERRDVPAAASDHEVPPPERRGPAVATERLTRLRPDETVGGEARTALESHDRLLGARAENAVDGSHVQAVRPEADLKRSDVRIPGTDVGILGTDVRIPPAEAGCTTRERGREQPEHRQSRR